MLSILLLYFVGKPFYTLAETNNKSKWGYAILSILVFYFGSFFGGAIIGIAMVLIGGWTFDEIDKMNQYVVGILAMPFGLLAAWGLYQLLKRNWEQPTNQAIDTDILDQNF
jgi:cytochrome c biogenesis protein CcdA